VKTLPEKDSMTTTIYVIVHLERIFTLLFKAASIVPEPLSILIYVTLTNKSNEEW